MKRTMRTLAGICWVLLLGSAVCAQAVQERPMVSEAYGYSFAAPAGWTTQASGEGYALVDPANKILIAVKEHAYKDFAAFMAEANFERDGLEPVGKPQEVQGGHTFRTVKRTPKGIAVIDTTVLFSPHGGGVMIVAITDEANGKLGFESGLAIAGGVKFELPREGAAARKVRTALAGKQLTYLYTGSGYSERKDILLCSSGTFYQSSDMGGFSPGNVDGPSFAATGGKSGTWSISGNGTRLVLRFSGGSTTEFVISARQASNEVGLNGQRYFVQNQSRCN